MTDHQTEWPNLDYAAEARQICRDAQADREEIRRLRALILDMGRVIRRLDDEHEHLEWWTQDGDYVLDSRWPE